MSSPNSSRRPLSLPEKDQISDRINDQWRRVRLSKHYGWLSSMGATIIISPDHGMRQPAASVAVAQPETRAGQKVQFLINRGADATKIASAPSASGQQPSLLKPSLLNGLKSLVITDANAVRATFNSASWSNIRGYFALVRSTSILSTNGAPISNLGTISLNEHYPYSDGQAYLHAFSANRQGMGLYYPPGKWHLLHIQHSGTAWKVEQILRGKTRLLYSSTNLTTHAYNNPTGTPTIGTSIVNLSWGGEIGLIVGYPTGGVANAQVMAEQTLAVYGFDKPLRERLAKFDPLQLFIADDGTYANTSLTTPILINNSIQYWKNHGSLSSYATGIASPAAPYLYRGAALLDEPCIRLSSGNTQAFSHTYSAIGVNPDYTILAVIRPRIVPPNITYRGIYSQGTATLFSAVPGSRWGTYGGSAEHKANTQLEVGRTYLLEMSGKHGRGGSFYLDGLPDGSYYATAGQGSHIGGFNTQVTDDDIMAVMVFNRIITPKERALIAAEFKLEYGILGIVGDVEEPDIDPDVLTYLILDADGNRAVDADGSYPTNI